MVEDQRKRYVYCSGPLFCPEEIGGMSAIAAVLEEAGYGTFLPHRDGLDALLMRFVNSPLNVDLLGSRRLIDRAIFALDVYQIVERCELFVLNMNGRVPDEGAVAETAIAFAVGKPIVIYKNDVRSAFKGGDNSMITGLSGSSKVSDIKRIPAELSRAAKSVEALGKTVYAGESMPPVMWKTVRLGRAIWNAFCRVRSEGSGGPASDLIDEITRLCKEHPALGNSGG